MFRITDSVRLSDKVSITPDGYLESAARTARTGVQNYLGAELGRPDLRMVSVYRDESQVFSKASLATFSKLPITNEHPATEVNSSNWKDLAVGITGDDVLRDGEYLKIGLKITDAAAVKLIKDGKRELSVGYSAEIKWADGIAPDGTPYQAVQENITANHIAIVHRGRAGDARIGDSWGIESLNDENFQPGITPKPKESLMTDSLKTVVLGDVAVQVSISDVAAIERYKADMTKALADAKKEKEESDEDKDEEIGKLKAELKTAKDAAIIDVDKLVIERTELVGKVKAMDAKIDPKGKTDAELRKAAVAAKLGDAMVADASEAEINGMFKALAKDVKPSNPVADALRDGVVTHADAEAAAKSALTKSITDMNAWRKEA